MTTSAAPTARSGDPADVDEGARTSIAEARAWLAERRAVAQGRVERIPLAGLDGWRLEGDPLRLAHESGRFFAIEGYTVREDDDGDVRFRDQPLIDQPEVGILGFLARDIGGTLHLLVQAKMEPGNAGRVQLAPTVQATHSNYTRVHRGRAQPFLKRFLAPGLGARVLVDELQPEQAAYFLAKRNRNMVVEIGDDVDAGEDFRWLTVRQVRALLATDYAVNMDARSVLSCLPCAEGSPEAVPTVLDDGVQEWLLAWSRRRRVALVRRPLDALAGWQLGERRLAPVGGAGSFGVSAVAVEAPMREVRAWTQPMLERPGVGQLGLLCRRRRGTMHVLAQATVEPGCGTAVQLSPTVTCHGDWDDIRAAHQVGFGEWFRDPHATYVRFTALHSEEGGRFDHFVYRYTIAEVPAGAELDLSPEHRWITLEQLGQLRRAGLVSIELRSMTACLRSVAPAA
jgi:oxidase EvaA